jgi:radical SAM superfamily enzyme YgiQ (UPF0313 family)
MKITIVSTNRCRVPVTVMPIGACRVAEAAAGAGHEVRVLDLMFTRRPEEALKEHLAGFRPDCVGFSVRNIDNGDLCDPVSYWRDLPDLIGIVRKSVDATVLIGGGAVSVMPRRLLRWTGADCAVVGEGERAIGQLLASLERDEEIGCIAGTAWLKDGHPRLIPSAHDCDMSGPVAPQYHRWIDVRRYVREGAAAPVQTKRGCPRQCVYCTYPLLEGADHRVASPRRVADAVIRLGRDGIGDVEFVDNVFNDPPEHALRICEELVRQGNPVRLHTVDLSPRGLDERLLSLMRRAGFAGFGLTVESACDGVLKALGKGYGAEDVRQAADAVRRQELPCMWMYMLGGPGETQETVLRTLDFAESHCRPGDMAVFFPGIRLFPGTELERIACRDGLLGPDGVDSLEPVFYLSLAVDRDWLVRGVDRRARRVPGFLPPASRTASFLPAVYRVARWLGIDPPLWRYTTRLRRFLAPLGM